MTLRLYDDTTHQAVPREPNDKMVRSGGSSHDHPSVYMGGPSQHGMRLAARVYTAMIAAAPPHASRPLPTQAELALAIAKAEYGYDVAPAGWRYVAADAVLALLNGKQK